VFDGEPDIVRRAVRPLLRSVGLHCERATGCRLEAITTDGMTLVMSDGTRETWTRAPAEGRSSTSGKDDASIPR
jgi:hypothetical protein